MFGNSILELGPLSLILVFFSITTTRYYHIISIKQTLSPIKSIVKDFKLLMTSVKCEGVYSLVLYVYCVPCTQLSSQNVSLPDYLSLQDVTVQTQKATNLYFSLYFVFCFFFELLYFVFQKQIKERSPDPINNNFKSLFHTVLLFILATQISI